ncbi:GyrI-like domain-containing protein [uncultured Clostridium sp.]|uniref:AraC family transcriptional regulator n=1 Tax=uncultured Clostridium sp. TaxID=59620 RepID=UPI0025F5E2FA|nr:GyrI-like domain-containing protein [uncultured Clostridium sp.]
MKMIIEKMPKMNIAFYRNVGPYGNSNYTTMEKIKKFAQVNNLFNEDTVILGISRDNPETTEPEKCRYDAGIVVSEDFNIEKEDLQKGTVDGGKYVVFIIEHTAEAVQKAWNELFQEILKKGYKMDLSRYIIERYTVKMIKDCKCEICVPIL